MIAQLLLRKIGSSGHTMLKKQAELMKARRGKQFSYVLRWEWIVASPNLVAALPWTH